MNQNQHQQQRQIAAPIPPSRATISEFFAQGCASPFTIDAEGSITIPRDSQFYDQVLQMALGNWVQTTQLNVITRRGPLGRIEAGVIKAPTLVGTLPQLLCKYTHEAEGEAAFNAVLLYTEMKKQGKFDQNLLPTKERSDDDNGQIINGAASSMDGES